jgi:hypothetical protein
VDPFDERRLRRRGPLLHAMTSLIPWTDSVGLRNDLLGSGVLRWLSIWCKGLDSAAIA